MFDNSNLTCEWPALSKGSVCIRCGYTLRMDYATAPVRECVKVETCPHYLGPTRDTVLMLNCGGCRGNSPTGVPVAIAECDLYELCVPFPQGDLPPGTEIKRCRDCQDNPRNKLREKAAPS